MSFIFEMDVRFSDRNESNILWNFCCNFCSCKLSSEVLVVVTDLLYASMICDGVRCFFFFERGSKGCVVFTAQYPFPSEDVNRSAYSRSSCVSPV